MVDRKIVDYSNLSLSEGNGHWCASWERGGRHFNTDELYGCSQKRSFSQLKSIMENDQGISLPPEIAVKSTAQVQCEMGRKTYKIDEKWMNQDNKSKFTHNHSNHYDYNR